MFRRLDKEIILTIVSRLAIVLAGIVTSIITARLLGIEGRGIYFYAVTLAGFVTQFANFGFPSANVYLVAHDRARLSPLVINSIWMCVTTFVVAAFVLLATAPLLHQDNAIVLLAAALGAINLLFQLLSNLLVGIQETRRFNLIQLLANGLTLLFAALAGWLNGTPGHFMMATIFAILIASAISLHVLHPGWRRWSFDAPLFKQAANYSLRAFAVTLIGYAMLRGNVMLLKHYSDATHLGYYSIATQITDALNILPTSYALVVFPRLVQEKVGNRYENMLRQTKIVALLTLAACACAALIAPTFIRLAFGAAFLPAVELVYLMLPGTFFLAVTSIISQYLAAEGIPRITLYAWLISIAFMLLACILLIPTWQASGAAIAFSIGHAVLFTCMLFFVPRHEERRARKQ